MPAIDANGRHRIVRPERVGDLAGEDDALVPRTVQDGASHNRTG